MVFRLNIYPPGNESMSHQTGKGKSSSWKCRLGGDMLVSSRWFWCLLLPLKNIPQTSEETSTLDLRWFTVHSFKKNLHKKHQPHRKTMPVKSTYINLYQPSRSNKREDTTCLVFCVWGEWRLNHPFWSNMSSWTSDHHIQPLVNQGEHATKMKPPPPAVSLEGSFT